MLGGYPQVSVVDLRGSRTFLSKLIHSSRLPPSDSPDSSTSETLPLTRALDAGAGIGRITFGLLLYFANTVDIVEPIAQFTDTVRKHAASVRPTEKPTGALGTIHTLPLEKFQPSQTYDLIWNQWCLGHLPDSALVAYLRRMSASLSPDGWIVAKENVGSNAVGEDIYDEVDSSVTRSERSWRRIFTEAGLKVVREEVQKGFPKGLGLFEVKMWALRPQGGNNTEKDRGA